MSDFWSLEYAGSDDDSEDKDSVRPSQPVSRIQTHVTFEGPPSRTRSGDELAPHELPPLDAKPFDPNATTTQASFNHSNHPSEETHHSMADFDFANNVDHRQLLDQLNQLKESQQHESEQRGRQRSIAESVSTHLTELVEEELDEELRHVPTMTLTEIRAAFRDALLGLEYLHYHGIVHRDIKPANLLRKQDHRVKISDFGVSYLGKPIREGDDSAEASESESGELEEETELAKTVGTPAFYAPELCSLDIQPDHPTVSNQLDVWALGVTLYCLLYARTPFTADNEFALMRQIADEDVFISRKRLKAVEKASNSRSGSHGPLFRNVKDKRLPTELLYDDIDDELHDLLKRVFLKNPRDRITVKEIKRHPWVLRDIDSPRSWLEDTDPSKWHNGKRIEISNKEVQEAVIPLKVIERVKSLAKRAADAFGLSSSAAPRRRGQSSASSDAGSQTSSHSDHSGRSIKRSAPKPDETLAAILKAARERDHLQNDHQHPLSQSVTASPDVAATSDFGDEGSLSQVSSSEQLAASTSSLRRPSMPGRHDPMTSTAASIKTIKQSDVSKGKSPKQTSEASHHTVSSLGSIFGEASRAIIRSARSRDRKGTGKSPSRPTTSSSHASHTDDFHGKPSLAVSTAPAKGQMLVNQVKDIRRRSVQIDPATVLNTQTAQGSSSGPASLNVTRSSSPAFTQDAVFRTHQPHSSIGSQDSPGQYHPSNNYLELSPPIYQTKQGSAPPSRAVSSVSSEDHFSPSASYPSIPSAASADTSVDALVDRQKDDAKSNSTHSSDGTAHGEQREAILAPESDRLQPPEPSRHASYGDYYSVDTDDDDSDSDNDFLVMSRPQSRIHRTKDIASRLAKDAHAQGPSPLSKVERSESTMTVKQKDDSAASSDVQSDAPPVEQD